MSSYRTRKTAVKVDPPVAEAISGTSQTVEIATYLAEMLKGVRRLTEQSGRKDLAFLAYLLAMAEEESGCLAANAYH